MNLNLHVLRQPLLNMCAPKMIDLASDAQEPTVWKPDEWLQEQSDTTSAIFSVLSAYQMKPPWREE